MAIKQPFNKITVTFDDGSTKVFEHIQGRFQAYHNYRGKFQNPDSQWFEFHLSWIQPVSSEPVGKVEELAPEPEPDKEINLYDF